MAIPIGELTPHAVRAFGYGALHFSGRKALIAALRPLLGTGVTVLIKGSRCMNMEREVTALTGRGYPAWQGSESALTKINKG